MGPGIVANCTYHTGSLSRGGGATSVSKRALRIVKGAASPHLTRGTVNPADTALHCIALHCITLPAMTARHNTLIETS